MKEGLSHRQHLHPLGLPAVNYGRRKAGKHPSHPSKGGCDAAVERKITFSTDSLWGNYPCIQGIISLYLGLTEDKTATQSLIACLESATDNGTNFNHGFSEYSSLPYVTSIYVDLDSVLFWDYFSSAFTSRCDQSPWAPRSS